MNEQEAKDYLRWYDDTTAEYHYLAHFKTTRPFPIDYPDAGKKRSQAKIVLGIHEFQHTFEQMKRVHRGMTLEYYTNKRKKLGII